MKTMKNLCKRFNRLFHLFCADLDTINSYKGYYIVDIFDLETNIPYLHIFRSCADFRLWMDNVIID